MFKSRLISGRKDVVARGRSGRPAPRVDTSMDRQVLHGTLRSELDEPARLPAEFVALADAVSALRGDYERGALTRSQAAERLSKMRLTTSDGAEWTIGMTTGQWHRRFPDGEWNQAMPPEAADVDVNPASQAGADLLDAYFAADDAGHDDETGTPAAAVATGDVTDGAGEDVASLPAPGAGGAAAGVWGAPGAVAAGGDVDEPADDLRDGRDPIDASVPAPTIDVTGGPIVGEVDAPYPEVSVDASRAALPVYDTPAPSDAVRAAWGSGWVSVERQTTDDLEALFAAPSAEPSRLATSSGPGTPAGGSWDLDGDGWPDEVNLDDLFNDAGAESAAAGTTAEVWGRSGDGADVSAEGAADVGAHGLGVGDDALDDLALVARARDEMITDDPALADLLAEARGERPRPMTATNDDFGLPPELFG